MVFSNDCGCKAVNMVRVDKAETQTWANLRSAENDPFEIDLLDLHPLPCPCTQCTPSVNARDRDSVPTSHPPQLNTTMTIEEALAELDALSSSEEFCYAKIAKKHGVDRSTLSRKHRGVSGSRAEAGLARRNL